MDSLLLRSTLPLNLREHGKATLGKEKYCILLYIARKLEKPRRGTLTYPKSDKGSFVISLLVP